MKDTTSATSVINEAAAARTLESSRSDVNPTSPPEQDNRTPEKAEDADKPDVSRGSRNTQNTSSSSRGKRKDGKVTPIKQNDGPGKVTPPPPTPTPAPPPPIIEPENPLIGRFDEAFIYSSDYYFRGFDILDRISPDNGGSGATRWKFAYTQVLRPKVDGLTFEYGRVDAYDLQLPRGDASELPPNERGFNEDKKQFRKDNADFAIPNRQKYAEDQLFLKYTRMLPWDFEAALSLGYYRFNDGGWYQDVKERDSSPVNDTLESTLRVAYSGFRNKSDPNSVPWITPSISYTADFVGFNGEFAALDLASRSFNLPGKFLGTYAFRAGAGYDIGYNAPGDGWGYLSGGAGLSIPLAKSGLTLDLAADYVHALDDDRADSGAYFSVGLSTGYKWYKNSLKAESVMSKDPLSVAAATDHKWRLSGGTGWRTWTGNFQNGAAQPYDSLNLINRRIGSGDLGFASNGRAARYKNGSVSGTSPVGDANPGSSAYSGGIKGGSKTEDGDNTNVVFQSDRFEYDQEDSRQGFDSESDTELVSPYIHLHLDLTPSNWRGGFHFGIGALYSFSSGELDSGTQLTSLASGFETIRNFETIYAVDAIHAARFPGSSQVVTDGNAYGNFYESSSLKDAGPQRTEYAIRNNESRVASFTSSSVKFQAHELAIPFEFSCEIGTRLHLAFSVAPTLALLDAELDSVTDYRELPDLADGKVVKDQSEYRLFNFKSIIRFDDEESTGGANGGFSGTGQTSSSPNLSPKQPADKPSQPDQQSTGGKGGRANAPRFPGSSLKVVRDRRDSQELTWGVTATAAGRFDLDEKDRFFVEAWGRYGWLNEITISNSQAKMNGDPSNWSVGVGLGCRF